MMSDTDMRPGAEALATEQRQRRLLRRTIAGASVGNIIEQYDFALYGAVAALVFGHLFFPSFDPTAALLASFSTYSVGFVARPLGSMVAGHFGDLYGRKKVLVIMLLLAGISTTAIGVLPTFAAVGIWAPVFLVLTRFIQGFSFGGEYGGAILMVNESAPAGRRGFYTGFIPASSAIGVVLSTLILLVFALLPDADFEAWGWRVPFLLSIVLVIVGLIIRLKLEETTAFKKVEKVGGKSRKPVLEALKESPKEILLSAGISFGFGTINYVLLTWMLSYAATALHLPREAGLTGLMIGMVFYCISNWASSAISDRVGRRPIIMGGGILFAVFAFPLFTMVNTATPALMWGAMAIAMSFGGMIYGPLASLTSELFATRFRYSGASMGYQFGQTLGGGFSPLIATALFAATGGWWSVALYLMLGGIIVSLCTYAVTETAKKELKA